MAIREELERQGTWLFRWRSYLPLGLIALFAIAFQGYHWPFKNYARYATWAELCFGVSFLGLAVRCATVGFAPRGTSGRRGR